MKQAAFALAILLLSSLATFGLTQVDPRAKALLDGTEHNVAPQPETLETVDMTLCTTSFEGEKAQPEGCFRIVFDITNKRMYNETRLTLDGKEEVIKTVYRDGRALISDTFSDGATELPKAQVREVERTFERIFEGFSNPGSFPQECERATYDGPVRYGEIISGVGVTATTTMPSFAPGHPPSQKVTMQFIFDGKGRAIGTVIEAPQGIHTQGKLLTVFNDPDSSHRYRRYMNTSIYTLEGDKPTLTSKIRVTRYRVNQPVDDSLFRLEPTPNPKKP